MKHNSLSNAEKEAYIHKSIAYKLRFHRERMNFTQEAVAEYLNVSFQQIQKYENGVNRIPVGKLCLLAELYQISLIHFYEEDIVWKSLKMPLLPRGS